MTFLDDHWAFGQTLATELATVDGKRSGDDRRSVSFSASCRGI